MGNNNSNDRHRGNGGGSQFNQSNSLTDGNQHNHQNHHHHHHISSTLIPNPFEFIEFLKTASHQEINDHLLKFKKLLYTNHINMKDYLKGMEVVFYLNDNFQQSKDYFYNLSKPIFCSKVWGAKTMFYRCKTCALSPNSSICFDCFKAGPHEREGHDYMMSFASYGGSCDCGSLDSWKKSGFCENHVHPEVDIDPTTNMNAQNLFTTHIVIRHLLLVLMEINNRTFISRNITMNRYEFKASTISDYTTELLQWLKNTVEIGRSIAHVMSEELCYQRLDTQDLSLDNIKPLAYTKASSSDEFEFPMPLEYQPPLETILFMSDPEITSQYLLIILFLLCEHSFKFGFSQTYIKVYAHLCKKESIDNIFRFSPQVFSVASISEKFSFTKSGDGFLECIFSSLFYHFTNNSKGELVLDKHHVGIVSDLKTILQHHSIAHYLIIENRDILQKYINLLNIVQGGDSITRRSNTHVEYEDHDWINFFQVDTELKEISQILINSITEKDSLESLIDLVKFVSEFLLFESDLKDLEIYYGTPVTKKDLFKCEKSVSIFLPFQRFYGLLLLKIKKLYPDKPLKEIIPVGFRSGALVYPLILAQVFMHQVNQTYWVRNDDINLKKKVYVYSLFSLELDLSIIQLLSCIIDVNEFIIFASKEFGATLPVTLEDTSDYDYHHRYNHFLKFIIQVFQERYFFMGHDDLTKYVLVQILCSKPKPHSRIESIMNYLDRESKYEHILQLISDEQPPSGENPATYKMKNEYWKYFNLYYPLYSPYILGEESLQSFFEYKKNSSLSYPDSLPMPPSFIVDNIAMEMNSNQDRYNFLKFINSDYLQYMCTSILFQFLYSTPTSEIGCGVNEALYFLVLSTLAVKPMGEGDSLAWEILDEPCTGVTMYFDPVQCMLQQYKFMVKKTLSNRSASTLGLLIELYNEAKTENIHIDKREYIEVCLEKLASVHPSILERIQAKCPTFKQNASDTKSTATKLSDAKRRQAEIMAKFAQQQSKFLENISTDSDDDDYEISSNKSKTNTPGFKSPAAPTTPSTGSSTPLVKQLENDPMDINSSSSTLPHHQQHLQQQVNFKTSKDQFIENLCSQTCVLCFEGPQNDKNPLSLIAFEQFSKLISYSKNSFINRFHKDLEKYTNSNPLHAGFPSKKEFIDSLNCQSSLHIRSCGHYIHKKCYDNYFFKLGTQPTTEYDHYHSNRREFLCPMCRRVANIILPSFVEQKQVPPPPPIPIKPTNSIIYPTWLDFMKKRFKDLEASSSDSDPGRNTKFFVDLFETVTQANNTVQQSLLLFDGFSPLIYIQIISKNIEFLELASRPLGLNDNYNGNNNNNNTTTTTTTTTSTSKSTNNNNNNSKKSYPITNDLFSRDIHTIQTMFHLITNVNSVSMNIKSKEKIIDIVRGKSDSLLSIDPFSLFITLNSILEQPSPDDAEIIKNLVLEIFVIQFYLTIIYLENDITKKQMKTISAIFQQNITETQISNGLSKLEISIQPFLRCLCITYHCLYSSPVTLNKEDLVDKDLLYSTLKIQSLESLVTRALKNPLLNQWLAQLESKKYEPYFIVNFTRPRFIKLPNTFEEVFVGYSKECQKCKTKPEQSAVCLLCDTLVCIKGNCCVEQGISEAYRHTLRCGSLKMGFFLETKSPRIDIIRDYRKSIYQNCYLDQYGEPDPLLERGKTLVRNDNNLQELWNCWISHSIEDKFLSTSTLNARNL